MLIAFAANLPSNRCAIFMGYDSIEPQPDKAKVVIKAIMPKEHNADEFIFPVYLIPECKLRESEYLWNLR